MTESSEDLFRSAVGMADAGNYSDWTFSLFRRYVTGTVLEVGCGVGTFTRRMIDECRIDRLVSIDSSPAAVEHCRGKLAHPALELRCLDVGQAQGEFDAIICMNVLEHIEDDRTVLRHLVELLRPGGTLVLLVPAHRILFSAFDAEGGHHRRYDKREMERRIRAAGGSSLRLVQFYFNAVGALGYFFVYKILRKAPQADAGAEIGFFDRRIVPVMRRLEGRRMPFGLSLVSLVTKES